MRITINNKQQISSLAINRTKAKIEMLFAKFKDEITSIDLSIRDVNGPRGGLDKKCQIVVKLRRMEAIVATHDDAVLSKAISRAINKAHRATKRKVRRRSVVGSRRRTGLRFAFEN